MGIVDDVAVAAAERVERAGGARAGLFAWRKLVDTAQSAELRARGVLGAWRCAKELRDVDAIHQLAGVWETAGDGAWDAQIVALCMELAHGGLLVPATAIAYAETRRRGCAVAHYLYARCLEIAGDRRSADAFAAATAQAEKEGEKTIARASRVRRAAWLAREPETIAAAVDEAARVRAGDATPEERFVLACVMLRAPSRFARAGAIGTLDELVSRDSPLARPETRALAARAVRAAVRHADELGEAMTPLEVDRLLALLSREPIAKQAERAREAVRALAKLGEATSGGDRARGRDADDGRERTSADAAFDEALAAAARAFPELAPLHHRAREIVAGRVQPPANANEQRPTWDMLLDAAGAMREGKAALAAHALRVVAEREERSARRAPAQAWSVVRVALVSEDAELRGVAGRLAAALLASRRAPPRGWLGVAHSLSLADQDELATHARRYAALAKEPGAEDALAIALTREGWALARAGERRQAIARLREARSLAASRSG